MNIHEIAAYLDGELKTAETPDYATAFNGLQVENGGDITKVGAAVDATEQTIRQAIDRGCNVLVVHHGLFWDGGGHVRGRRYRRLKLLLDNNIAVYSSHLPLDVHPTLGNNALLALALGISVRSTFGSYQGMPVGLLGDLSIRRESLAARLDDLVGGRVKLIAGGPEQVTRVGVITGGAGTSALIAEAAALNLDAFVTGEGAHHTYSDAIELGVNVYYAGHYATETFGVRALATHLEEKFGLPWEFIDAPTGL